MSKALYALVGVLIIVAFLFVLPVAGFAFLPSMPSAPLQVLVMTGVLYFALQPQTGVRDAAFGVAGAIAC